MNLGDRVTWTVGPSWSRRRVSGRVVEIVPPHLVPKSRSLSPYGGVAARRDHQSYVVKGEHGGRHWPPVDDLLREPEPVRIDIRMDKNTATSVETHPSYRVDCGASASDLIDRSISHTEIVTHPWSAGLETDLLAESDDTVTSDDVIEFWGVTDCEDDDAPTWRVHLIRDDSAGEE